MRLIVQAIKESGSDQWAAHKAVWDACVSANVQVPEETRLYFNNIPPKRYGVITNLGPCGGAAARAWHSFESSGVDLRVADIPEGTTTIRFIAFQPTVGTDRDPIWSPQPAEQRQGQAGASEPRTPST